MRRARPPLLAGVLTLVVDAFVGLPLARQALATVTAGIEREVATLARHPLVPQHRSHGAGRPGAHRSVTTPVH